MKPVYFSKLCLRGNKRGSMRLVVARFARFACAALVCGLLVSCKKDGGQQVISPESEHEFLAAIGSGQGSGNAAGDSKSDPLYLERLQIALNEAHIPEALAAKIRAAPQSEFLPQLDAAMQGDPFLHLLVDKKHKLPDGYAPPDLVKLTGKDRSYTIGRNDLSLRTQAEEAFEEMARAARAEGITLLASSSYRSYDYQVEVYARNVRQSGQETADRESARPGYSQHQLGLIIDFGSISDEYAETAAGRWLLANAPRFGWSLSFPEGYEDITGYRWECWHYRYVGKPLAAFIQTWFGGIQQYALQFIHVWENGAPL